MIERWPTKGTSAFHHQSLTRFIFLPESAWDSDDGRLKYLLWATSLSWIAREQARFGRFRSRKRVRNVRFRARHYHLCYALSALSTQRRVSITETLIIPRKISIIPPQVSQTSRGKTPKAPPLWRILWRNWRDRTRYRYEIVSEEPNGEESVTA